MKKLLICLFIILFVTESLYALNTDGFSTIMKTAGKDDVSFNYKGQEIGRMSKAQLEAMINASEFYQKMTAIEKKGKVYAILKDNPWDIKVGSTFKSSMDIVWEDSDGTILKRITVDVQLMVDKKNQAFLIYQDVAVYLFPAAILVIIILILILTVK